MFVIINQPDSKKKKKFFSELLSFGYRNFQDVISKKKNLHRSGDLLNYARTSTKSLEGLEGKKTSVHKLLEPIYSFNILTLFALSVWNK